MAGVLDNLSQVLPPALRYAVRIQQNPRIQQQYIQYKYSFYQELCSSRKREESKAVYYGELASVDLNKLNLQYENSPQKVADRLISKIQKGLNNIPADSMNFFLDNLENRLNSMNSDSINLAKLILEKSEDKTIIIIAHRLSTVVDTDKIILIENGQIVEEGTHNELMSSNTRYKTMFDTQASLYLRKN